MTNENLKCPNCSASIAGNNVECPQCQTRLNTMACLSCLGVMFVGSRFCERCGAIAAPIGFHEDVNRPKCPTCRLQLTRTETDATSLFECMGCNGLWADIATFESLFVDSEIQSEILSFVGSRKIRSEVLTKTRHVPCPNCSESMNRNALAHSAGVILDICEKHGVWFDSHEFSKIVKFVVAGGVANPKLNEKLEIASERARLREKGLLPDASVENSPSVDFESGSSQGISNFIRTLLD